MYLLQQMSSSCSHDFRVMKQEEETDKLQICELCFFYLFIYFLHVSDCALNYGSPQRDKNLQQSSFDFTTVVGGCFAAFTCPS